MRTPEKAPDAYAAALPDVTERMRTADMGPRALAYAENLHKQVADIYERLGVASAEEIATLPRERLRVGAPDVRKLSQLVAELRHVLLNTKTVERGLRNMERAKRSIAAAEAVAQAYPSDVWTQFWLQMGKSDVARTLGEDPHAALFMAKKLAEQEPDGQTAMHSFLVRGYLHAGDFDEAATMANEIGDAEDKGYINALVAAYIEHGRLDDALSYTHVTQNGKRRSMPVHLAGKLYAALCVCDDADGRKRHDLMVHQEDKYAVQSRAVRYLVDDDKVDVALALTREVEAGFGNLECFKEVGMGMRRKKIDTTMVGVEMFEAVCVVMDDERLFDVAGEWVAAHKGKRPSSLTYACTAVSYIAKSKEAAPYIHGLAERAHANASTKAWLVKRLGEVTVALARSHGNEVALPYLREMKEERARFIEHDDVSSLEETDAAYAKALVACGRQKDAEYIAQGDLVSREVRCQIYLDIVQHTDPEDEEDVRRLLAEAEGVVTSTFGGLPNDEILSELGEAHALIDDVPGVIRYAERLAELWAKGGLMSYVVHSAKDARTAKEYLDIFRAMIARAEAADADNDEVQQVLETYVQLAVDMGLPNVLMDEMRSRPEMFTSSGIVSALIHHAVVKCREAKKYLS